MVKEPQSMELAGTNRPNAAGSSEGTVHGPESNLEKRSCCSSWRVTACSSRRRLILLASINFENEVIKRSL